jgi:integrase
MPTMKRFKADLIAAGIEFINAKGYRADFHSLRHTLATNLARAGTAPRVAMEIMRIATCALRRNIHRCGTSAGGRCRAEAAFH